MSSHADFLQELQQVQTEIGATAAKEFMWKNRELLLAALAEIQRLRDALQRLKGNVWEWEVPADVREQVDAALDGTPSAAQTLEDVTPDKERTGS